MLYSLVIADDEQMMRNGLTRMIQWEELGFELKAVFSDGQEVLDFLKRDLVDVLLMDIQMIRVSGLEVARFVSENRLPVKVVLLSGHKDFEYAQQAIACKVEQYMLKPISIPKFREQFKALHDKLEEQNVLDEALQYRMDRYNQMVDYERERLVLEAAMGAFSFPEELERRLRLTGLEDQGCLLVSAALQDSPEMREFISSYGSQELSDQLVHILKSIDERLDFYTVETRDSCVRGVFAEKSGGGLKTLSEDWGRFEGMVASVIQGILGIGAEVRVLQAFGGLWELARYKREHAAEPASQEFLHQLRELKKLLVTYMAQGEQEESAALFASFVDMASRRDIHFLRNQVIHLFSRLLVQLGDSPAIDQMVNAFAFSDLSGIRDIQGVADWGQKQIQLVTGQLAREKKADNNQSVARIRRYVEEHYAEDITLADAAEQVYLNPVYVSRLFKEQTGSTFTEYLTQLRVGKAIKLLEQGEKYVYEISEMVGYHNLKYFYKVFKKTTGCTPSEYVSRGTRGGGAV